MKINTPDNVCFPIIFSEMMMMHYNIVEIYVQNVKLKT